MDISEGRSGRAAWVGRRPNRGLQRLRAAPVHAVGSEINGRALCTLGMGRLASDGQKSTIDGPGGRKSGFRQRRQCGGGPQRSFVGKRLGNATVRTSWKRTRTSPRRLCSLWTSYIRFQSKISVELFSPAIFALELPNGFN